MALLNWQNIIDKKCAICAQPLVLTDDGKVFVCSDQDCGFYVTMRKFGMMIFDQNSPVNKYALPHQKEAIHRALEELKIVLQ